MQAGSENAKPSPKPLPKAAKPKVVIKRKANELGTPSISQALSGNFKEEVEEKVVAPEAYAKEVKSIDEPFTQDQLNEIWPSFAQRYEEQVHLYNTLTNKPELQDNCLVSIKVENSVQQDQIRQLKPEIIGYLRRSLKNSKIDVHVDLIKAQNEDKLLTSDQKMQAMIKKNPALLLMKNKFNLDFNG